MQSMNENQQQGPETIDSHAHQERPSQPSSVRHEIEVILARQLAGYLALPILIVDPAHVVVYYNEPAERMLGRRFDEGGPVPWAEWSRTFDIRGEDGEPLVPGETPIGTALRERRLVNRRFWLRGVDGIQRYWEETAIPLVGNAGRFLGAIGIFSEIEP